MSLLLSRWVPGARCLVLQAAKHAHSKNSNTTLQPFARRKKIKLQSILVYLFNMLSKPLLKYLKSLFLQKNRIAHKVYIAEGTKIAIEWLSATCPIEYIIATQDWADAHKHFISLHPEAELHIVQSYEMGQVSQLNTPQPVLLVVKAPEPTPLEWQNKWYIALEHLQDPGNMGSIIRIADWFGFAGILYTPDCADPFSPKVIQAGMGSHLRVQLHETHLTKIVKKTELPVIAATLSGSSPAELPRYSAGIIAIGNESKGLSEELIKTAKHCVTIPKRGGAESLNASVAAGILCASLTGTI
ncbi:MAG: RNA methyltransferase [Chitinophagia bacterium]|nr:RNA methyltransferase [Chitinophagia bacterium]